jgi:arabinofuranosyltransferase
VANEDRTRIAWHWIPPAVAGLLLSAASLAPAWSTWTDDAYISLRYARNWADGLGMATNQGERLEGLTNLGWALVLAPMAASDAWAPLPDPLVGAKVIGVACLIATVLMVLDWCRRQGLGPWLALVPVAFVSAVPWAPYWAVQGLETPLVMLLTTMVWWRADEAPLGWSAILGAALAPWIRPDAALLAPLLLLWALPRRPGARNVGRALLVIGASAACLIGVKLWWFGEVLPNTFYVKTSAWPWMGGLQYAVNLLVEPWPVLGAALLLGLIFGLGGAVLPGRRPRGAVLPALVGLVGIAAAVASNGDFFPNFRLVVPALPALAAAVGALLFLLFGRATWRVQAPVGIAVATLLAGPVTNVHRIEGLTRADAFPQPDVDVQRRTTPYWAPWTSDSWGSGWEETWAWPAAWALVHLNPLETAAFTDIGLFGWVHCGPVVDLIGLTDRTMAGRGGRGFYGEWRTQRAYLDGRVHFLFLDQQSGRWDRYRAWFDASGWRAVDGCSGVRVVAGPKVTRDARGAWTNGLAERVEQTLRSTPGHLHLHLAILRELGTAGAPPEVIMATMMVLRGDPDARAQRAVAEVACQVGLGEGCTMQADSCGSAHPQTRNNDLGPIRAPHPDIAPREGGSRPGER